MSWVIRISAMPVSRLQPGQQVQDLRLNGHVERRGRLVGDQQPRPAGDGHGDHHALVHAARELMRKGREAAGRLGDPDLIEQLDGPVAARPAVEGHVRAQRLLDLKADGETGVQRGHRLLEDHRHDPCR
jgi:hypothetical protein